MALESLCGFKTGGPMFSNFGALSETEDDIDAHAPNFKDHMKLMLPPSLDVRSP
jgi:hypothetical protein